MRTASERSSVPGEPRTRQTLTDIDGNQTVHRADQRCEVAATVTEADDTLGRPEPPSGAILDEEARLLQHVRATVAGIESDETATKRWQELIAERSSEVRSLETQAPRIPSAALAALDRATGAVRWKGFDVGGGYSSPVLAELGGVKQAIFFTAYGLISVVPETGEELWRHPFKTSYDANIATPIVFRDYVFISAGYGSGSALVRIEKNDKGFAVTLSLGIVTSMFTAIMGTRAIVNAVFGGRRLKSLPV